MKVLHLISGFMGKNLKTGSYIPGNFIFSTCLQIFKTSLRSELRITTFLSRPKLTYSTKVKGTSPPDSASRNMSYRLSEVHL